MHLKTAMQRLGLLYKFNPTSPMGLAKIKRLLEINRRRAKAQIVCRLVEGLRGAGQTQHIAALELPFVHATSAPPRMPAFSYR